MFAVESIGSQSNMSLQTLGIYTNRVTEELRRQMQQRRNIEKEMRLGMDWKRERTNSLKKDPARVGVTSSTTFVVGKSKVYYGKQDLPAEG